MNKAKPSKTVYRVVSSPWEELTPPPWDYEENGFVRWVDEVFLEGYKGDKDAPFPSLGECLDILETNGYEVEVIDGDLPS